MRQKVIRGLIWQGLLTKRLLKKPVFLITLCMIPLLCLAMNIYAKEESGIIRVALYTRDNDVLADSLIDSLLEKQSIVLFEEYPDEERAITALKEGKVDSAWGFTENFTEKIKQYADEINDGVPLIEVWEKEENITFKLLHEKIPEVLMPVLVKEIYRAYLSDELAFDTELNSEVIGKYFEDARLTNELIKMEFVNNTVVIDSTNYLSTPLRGMIAVIVMIGGIAAAMVFVEEKERGIYSNLSERQQLPVLMASCAGALFCCGTVALVALWFSGDFRDIFREIGMMAIYLVICVPFCTLMALVFRKASSLAVFLPILVIISLVFCPIFLNHHVGKPIQYCLPTYYYLGAMTGGRFVPLMCWFAMVCIALCFAVKLISKLRVSHIGR